MAGSFQPAYMQIYADLRREITGGVHPFGSRIPSRRTTAENYNVSLITVSHAYDILVDEGFLVARQRSGYYVAYRAEDVLDQPETEMPLQALPAQSRSGEELPFAAYARAMRNVLSRYGDALMERCPTAGVPALRQAVADYLLATRSIRLSPEQVIIGSGAEYLYGLVVQLLGRDRVFALEDPSYPMIRQVYEAQGVTCQMLPMGRDGIRSSALKKCQATVLHVTPFHSFPSGITAGASKRQEYLRFARERNGYIVEDDFDSEFTASTKSEDTLFALDPLERVLHVNTFSKTIAPSLRAGYMLLPRSMLDIFEARAGFYSCPVPVTEQYVIAELIRSGEFVRHINRVRRRRRKSGEKGRNMSDLA